MYKTTVNNKHNYEIDFDGDLNSGTINGNSFELDNWSGHDRSRHVLYKNKSYTIEIVEVNKAEKKAQILVNNHPYSVELKDELDLMLEKLGMDVGAGAVIKELKAPMPGLVIDVKVNIGDIIKKGDPLMVLEAMKMENVLKAPADVEIESIVVTPGNTIEKNATLITFK